MTERLKTFINKKLFLHYAKPQFINKYQVPRIEKNCYKSRISDASQNAKNSNHR
jgi:hypothetical protein